MTKTLILTERQAQGLMELIDAGVRHVGLGAAPVAAELFALIQNAPTVEGGELIEGATNDA